MLKISFAGCLSLLPAVSVQFTLRTCATAQNREKFIKNPYFGNSRSLTLINLKSPSSVLVIRCSKSVPICSHFSQYTSQQRQKWLLVEVPLF